MLTKDELGIIRAYATELMPGDWEAHTLAAVALVADELAAHLKRESGQRSLTVGEIKLAVNVSFGAVQKMEERIAQ